MNNLKIKKFDQFCTLFTHIMHNILHAHHEVPNLLQYQLLLGIW